MLTGRGIEANPDKCAAIINMRSPTTVKEVQKLTGRVAALARFLSKSGNRAFPFYRCLKKNDKFQWTNECEEAFLKLKEFLAMPPILTKPDLGTLYLYLSVTDQAVSAVLVQEIGKDQQPIYFVSTVLHGVETRYQKIEKLDLALVVAARRLRPYFQCHPIVVRTDQPVRQVLQKPDLARRMVGWSVELSEFRLQYEPRGAMKAQVLSDFVVELTHPAEEQVHRTWYLSVDGASNLAGSGAGIVLEGPEGILIEQSLRFEFKASNNQVKYEALIVGMRLAKEMGATTLQARSDSQLVTGQVSGNFRPRTHSWRST